MFKKVYFDYGDREVAHLKARDSRLGAAIDEIGHIRREIIPDLFTALVHAIIGQQISSKALATIWARIQERFSPITAKNIGEATEEQLQCCGMSFRKASCIKQIANSVLDGSLDLEHLQTLSNDEVCERLNQLKGIGIWTAEMLMTFSMQRPNVMSMNDLAILRGLRMLYHHREITPRLFAKYKRCYSPYATVASLYLWAIAGGACPGLVDHTSMTQTQKMVRIAKRKQQ